VVDSSEVFAGFARGDSVEDIIDAHEADTHAALASVYGSFLADDWTGR
jgi:hypothetical protein